MNSNYFSKIVNTLIDNLPNEYRFSTSPLELDLVLDGGVFNGSYLIGALLLLKEMEKRNYVKVKRISGCSIGSLAGLLYFIDSLDIIYIFYDEMLNHFKKKYNFEIYKNLKKFLTNRIPENICSLINKKLYIKYNQVQKGVQKVKCKFTNVNDILNTIIKSSFFPYLIDGNVCYKNKYLDGVNAYIFKEKPNRKILFMDLCGIDKFTNILNIKNEKTNIHRILYGMLDLNTFLIKRQETSMCSYVDEWTFINTTRLYMRIIVEKILCYVSYIACYIKKYYMKHTSYKIISKIAYDILIILLQKYCL
jgi:hypothetical protein